MCQTSPFRSAPCDGSEFMAKRTLYACGRVAFILAALVTSTTAVVFAQSGEAPCAACIVLVASPGQSVLFAEPLNGIEVLIAADGSDDAAVASAVAAVSSAGGRPGLFVSAGTLNGAHVSEGL